MRWTSALLLRPVTFVLAIVAAVIAGDRGDSFWYGLLTFFVALGLGRVLGALVRGRPDKALARAVWPLAAVVYAFLFAWLGIPSWGTFFAAWIAASLTRGALPGPRRPRWAVAAGARRVDLDELLP